MKFLIFLKNLVFELKSGVHLSIRNLHTVFFGTESIITNLGAKLWNMVAEDISKSSVSLNVLKLNTGHQNIVRAEFVKHRSVKLVL